MAIYWLGVISGIAIAVAAYLALGVGLLILFERDNAAGPLPIEGDEANG